MSLHFPRGARIVQQAPRCDRGRNMKTFNTDLCPYDLLLHFEHTRSKPFHSFDTGIRTNFLYLSYSSYFQVPFTLIYTNMQFAKLLTLGSVASAAAVAKSRRDEGLSSKIPVTKSPYILRSILTKCPSLLRYGLFERDPQYRRLWMQRRPEWHRA